MAMPSNLQCELKKLQQQNPGTRLWWAHRVAITVGLLNVPLLALVKGMGAWGFGLLLLILTGAMGLWWVAARLSDRERRRIECKEASGRFGGWRSAVPMLVLLPALILGLRPSPFVASTVIPLSIFVGLVFLMEQTLAAKRGSFDLLDAREQVLRAKLAPHFIFNTLNTLHAQIEQDPRGAQATTERLAQLFRQVIAVSDLPTIPLKQELEFVEAYLGIEQARLGDRLEVTVDIPEAFESAEIPPLSLQVLVENAIKHGVAPLEKGGRVGICAELKNGALWLWVEDPGSGVSTQNGTGTALKTLRQRLERTEDLVMSLVDGRHRVSFRWRQA